MLGDRIHIKEEYYATADALCQLLKNIPAWQAPKMIVAIAGESGSGKSVTAVCLQHKLATYGRKALLIHQDDYFKLPPASNHAKRLEDRSWIGPQEVRLELINYTISAFLSNHTEIEVPLIHYQANTILSEVIQLMGYDTIIVEGTYALMVGPSDFHVFMDRTYLETQAQRIARGREEQTAFIEEVLAIEHELIRPQKLKAHAVIDRNYAVVAGDAAKHTI